VITLTLPYPISANRYWTTRVVTPKGTRKPMAITHPSTEAQAYRRQVEQAAVLCAIGKPLAGRVRIDIALYPHRPQDWVKRARVAPLTWDDDVRCIDLDNANKVLLDALKGIAIEDDKWVRELHSQRMEPDGEARVVVTITPLALPASPQAELLPTHAVRWENPQGPDAPFPIREATCG
jgi:crossover junction endodeoxyribonuclease RusA